MVLGRALQTSSASSLVSSILLLLLLLPVPPLLLVAAVLLLLLLLVAAVLLRVAVRWLRRATVPTVCGGGAGRVVLRLAGDVHLDDGARNVEDRHNPDLRITFWTSLGVRPSKP